MKLVIASGGNALLRPSQAPSAANLLDNARRAAKQLANSEGVRRLGASPKPVQVMVMDAIRCLLAWIGANPINAAWAKRRRKSWRNSALPLAPWAPRWKR
jgi:carbamate kinase